MPSAHTDLVALLHHAHRGPAWHGPCLKSTLRGITFEEATWRPCKGRNTIWELVLHAAYGKYLVAQRIDPTVAAFPRKLSRSWWPKSAGNERGHWKEDLRLLETCQAVLVEVVERSSQRQLARKQSEAARWNLESEVVGVALHDTYHGGQIRLLRRLFAESKK